MIVTIHNHAHSFMNFVTIKSLLVRRVNFKLDLELSTARS